MIYAELIGNYKSWGIKSPQDNKLKEMLWARCLAKGANRIGSDLLLGLYTTDELTDTLHVNEKDIKRDEDGTVLQVTPHEEIKS